MDLSTGMDESYIWIKVNLTIFPLENQIPSPPIN